MKPNEHLYVPYVWRRQLAFIRFMLGVICLVAQFYYPMFPLPVVPAVLVLYSAWALGVLLSATLEQINYTTTSVIIDASLFLTMVLNPAKELFWLNHIAYFFVLTNTSLLFTWKHVSTVTIACLAFLMLRRPLHYEDLAPIVLLAGSLAVIMSLLKSHLQDRVANALARSVMARGEAEVARFQERERIAHDFHDGPQQVFISFAMRLELLRKLITKDTSKAQEELARMKEICDNQVTELRLFVRNMRPPEWEGDNASAGFRDVLRIFQKDTGIQVAFSADESLTIDDQTLFTELLQVFREALHNIQKHARASHTVVSIDRDGQFLRIRVQDDGNGFPFAGEFSIDELDALRLGPVSIKRRIRSLGGDMHLRSRPGEGAELSIEVPV